MFSVGEIHLVNFIKDRANMHYGLTKQQVRVLASQFAIANNKKAKKNLMIHGKGKECWVAMARGF